MDAQTIVNEINRKLNGEFETVAFGTDDWNTIVSTLNENIDLYNRSESWRTSYNPMYSVGTVSDAIYYKIKNSEISTISDSNRAFVLFYDENNVIIDKYKLIAQDLFDQAGIGDKVVTLNSQGLQIKPKTATDKIYGTNIVLPAFLNIKQVSGVSDQITTDDNYWLITKTASDLASTSPVSFIARNAAPLAKQAELRMKTMKKVNRTSQSSTPAYGGWNPITGTDVWNLNIGVDGR